MSLLRYAELDQSEPISYDDFEKLMRAQYLGRSFDELVERAFKVFDAENRGHITVKGYYRTLGAQLEASTLKKPASKCRVKTGNKRRRA